MRTIFFSLSFFALLACSTLDNDLSSHNRRLYSHTRIDFTPISRAEKNKLLQLEKQVYEMKVAPLKQRLEEISAARAVRYNEIKDQFPDCEKQKHCVSELGRGDVKAFERYNALTKSLREYDVDAIDQQAMIRNWELRFQLRSRSINNRFLAYELMQVPRLNSRVSAVTVHSLEAFDSRRPLSMRLLQMADYDSIAGVWGDLNFQMLGKPVDEAAVIATYDIWLKNADPSKAPTRFVASFLVNAQEPDELGYDDGFLRHWGQLFAEPEQRGLRDKALCGLYSVAGETLAAKLPAAKAKLCAAERNRMQTRLPKSQFAAEEWILPIGYLELQDGSERRN